MKAVFLILALFSASAATTIQVRVVDNFTRVPLSNAILTLQTAPKSAARTLKASAQGLFEFDLTDAGCQFEVQAEGYGSYQSPRLTRESALSFYDLALERQEPFEGVIVAPTGQLASGARYFLCTELTEVTFTPDRQFFTRSRPPSVCGTNAVFRLWPESAGHSILVAHDLGYAFVPLAGWKNGGTIYLKPWARLAGRVFINGAPAKEQRVALQGGDHALGRTKMTLLNFETTTDREGHFAFENVPAGEVYLAWMLPIANMRLMYSHRTLLFADPANNAEVTVNLAGRNLVGAFAPQTSQPIDWKKLRVFGFIYSKPSEVPLELWRPDLGVAASGHSQLYPLLVDDDLNFKATAIPAGDYTIRLTAYDTPETGQPQNFNFQSAIRIPGGEGKFDLGKVSVTNAVRTQVN
jgi:hypothetical protein